MRYNPESIQRMVVWAAPYTVTDSDGNLDVFNVERNDDGLWLDGNNGNPDNFWNGNYRWVFVRPRN